MAGDHPHPDDMGHGYGETAEQHAAHLQAEHLKHWGLSNHHETILFYCFAVPSWCCQLAAGVLGSVLGTAYPSFIGTVTCYLVLHWAAWFQTAVGMAIRASWVRDESNLEDRRRFLYLAVRLNRLMIPTAVINLAVFIPAYVRRHSTQDLANWLIFLLFFIFATVGSVMNAYNNITWESDRLEYEEGRSPYGNTMLAILGIATKPEPKSAEHFD